MANTNTASASVRVDGKLYNSAKKDGAANFRSAAQQINFWAMVGRNALANPDLPVEFVAELLIAKDMETEPFVLEDEK